MRIITAAIEVDSGKFKLSDLRAISIYNAKKTYDH